MKLIQFQKTQEKDEAPAKPDFETVYQEHYAKVLHYLQAKVSNKDEAEELASTVFLYCFEHYDAYDPEKSAVSTWIFLVVNSRLKNYYRDRKVTADITELEEVLYEENEEMDHAVYLTQLRDAMANALDSLPERQRMAVVLRYFKEKSYDEIAAELGMTAGNVRVTVSRAMDKLSEQMENFR